MTLGHWRTNAGANARDDEVDLVVEYDDGKVLAFEVKASQRVAGNELAGLRKLRDSLGRRFVSGVAFSTGERSFTFEDRIHILPIDRLWRTVGQAVSDSAE